MPSSADDISPNESFDQQTNAASATARTMCKTESVAKMQSEVQCPNCDLKFTTEDQLQSHVFECHPGLLPEEEEEDGATIEECKSDDDKKNCSKSKNLKCRHCNFLAKNKLEFWEHGTIHIKPEKMLTCPKCSFVTEYKHHLEYHLRNHFGSKPFKCSKCNYSCVNKSMLNSHMKSHSTVYQYRCLDCSYATKYCHSLKLHLRKYSHKPAVVLNPDGTPNPLPIIDVYGTRRGPRPKKQKPGSNKVAPVPQQTTTLPSFYISPSIFGGLSKMSPMIPNGMKSTSEPDDKLPLVSGMIRCNNCEYQTIDRELFSKHMVQHIAKERQEEEERQRLGSQSDEPGSPRSPPPSNPIFAPLDLTVNNEMEKSAKVSEFNSYFHHHYASSLNTDVDTSSTPSMSPDDVMNSLQRSPPPLHPLSETLANFIARRRSYSDAFRIKGQSVFSEPESQSFFKKQWREVHTCIYCDMAFENYSMYTMHMGYHGYANPFKCNRCGHQSEDKVSFFLHMARIAHV